MSSTTAAVSAQQDPFLFAKYDPTTFYYKVLGLMIHKPEFRQYASEMLKPEYFASHKVAKTFALIILEYHKKFPSEIPSTTVFFDSMRILRDKKVILPEEVKTYSDAYEIMRETPSDPGYIEQEVRKFAAKMSMETALTQSLSDLDNGHFEKIVERINNAASAIQPTASTQAVELISASAQEDFFKLLETPEAMIRKGISTGIDALDDIMFFKGVDAKELFIVCGSPGRGKSPFLQAIALRNTLFNGKTGVYYTLEVSSKIVRLRQNAMLTSIPIVDLANSVPDLRTRWQKILAFYPSPGELILYDLPQFTLKPSHIRRDLKLLSDKGKKIDFVVVDYADIMASDRNFRAEDKRLEAGNIYGELRSIAKEFDLAVFTASQGNRASLSKIEVDLDSMSEDFSKAFTADYVVGLCQSKEEKKKLHPSGTPTTGYMRIFVAKNRNEQKHTSIGIWNDFTKMRLCADDWWKLDNIHFSLPIPKAPFTV